MKHPKVWTILALLMLAGCGPREQLTIIRNVQVPPPDTEAKVVPLDQFAARESEPATAEAAVPKAE